MNDSLKKRLIGAIVLVSLAVIFIPMFLNGPREFTSSQRVGGVPPKPDYRFRAIDIPLDPAVEVEKERVAVVETAEEADQALSAMPDADAPAPVQGQPTEEKAKQEQHADAEDQRTPDMGLRQKGDGPTAWVVQVGSFARSGNAFALRDKLRKAGLPTFVEKVATAESVFFRVRVGPEISREAALALQKRAAPVAGTKGLIMQHL